MRKLVGAAGLLAGSSILALLLSFGTQTYLAFRFGSNAEMDAYVAAMTLPAMFVAVVVGGLGTVLIPVFVESMLSRGAQPTWRMASTLFNLTFIVIAVGALATHVFGVPLMRLLAPGLSSSTRNLSVSLMDLLMPAMMLTLPITALTGFLQAQERFLHTAIAPIAGAAVMLGSAVLLCPAHGIFGIAEAAIAGNVVQLLWLLPVFNGRYRAVLSLKDEGLRRMGALLLPLVCGGLVFRATIVADRRVASLLPAGSLSHVEYASKIAGLLTIVFASGIAAALYPRMSSLAADQEMGRLRDTLVWGQRIVMLFLFPALATGWVLRIPLLQLAFQRGQFSAADTKTVAQIVSWFLLGVVGGSLGVLQARVYYVMKDTITPVWIGVLETIGYFIYLPLLAKQFGAPGVGMANACYLLAGLVVNGIVVFRKMGGARFSDLLSSGARISLFAAMAAVCAWGASRLFEAPLPMIAAGSAAAAICYGTLLFAARSREIQDLAQLVADVGVREAC
jgi:putative peptidoglycan lipid II flippase